MKTQISTYIGPLYLTTSEAGVTGVHFRPADEVVDSQNAAAQEHMKALIGQLNEYFLGLRRTFDLKLDLFEGTAFQNRTWRGLLEIPYGQTCSYRDLALSIGAGAAYRAVGSANGRNPIAIVIPCHRVIAADGSLGGFGGGLEVKRKLLALEQRLLRSLNADQLEQKNQTFELLT